MSASETSPIASNLQESIESLIAETVRRSQSEHEEEKQKLTAALQSALTDIEAGQSALNRAADTLQAALEGSAPPIKAIAESTDTEVEAAPPAPASTDEAAREQDEASTTKTTVGPHDLNVIAHNVTIGIASSLQSLLRGRPEVKSAQTREFVNGELRLELAMESGLDIAAIREWIASHGGNIATQTDSVLELRFGD